ncbi:MAG TPA: hypothetical protein VIM11_08525 [Tepidisphaeraceae bacterium]
MQYRMWVRIAVTIAALATYDRLAAAADTLAPTTLPASAPSTRPAGFPIRGTISVEQSWSVQQPNLSRIAVYLASDPKLDAQTPRVKFEVTQYRKAFDPDLLIIPRGAEVEFPNWDHFDHNVFSRSRAGPAFDLDRFGFSFYKSRVFDTPGVIHVFCNIHPQMHGMIIVTPNAIFARAASDGRFELPPVPPGQYTLVAWYERSGETRQIVTVSESGQISDAVIVLKENRDSVLANVPPDHGSKYGVERGLGIKQERLDLPVVHDLHEIPASNKR